MKASFRVLTLLVLLCDSYVLAGQAVDLQDFKQYKQMMLPVLSKSIEPLKKTRACVVSSANSDQLNACIEVMAARQREMMPGPAGGGGVVPQMPKLEWSRATIEQMRSDLDRSLIENSASIKCMQSSDSHETMAECMREAK